MSEGASSSIALERWLNQRGLWHNPFAAWYAERDPELPGYFVDMGQFDQLLNQTEPCLVLAGRGCGKTAQRHMLATHCRPLKRDSSRLAVTYGYAGFERALRDANNDTAQMEPMHHVGALLYLALSVLVGEMEHDLEVRTALRRPDVAPQLAAYIARFAPRLAETTTEEEAGVLDSLTSLELLQGWARLVQGAGLTTCAVLVDGLDEFPRLADDPGQSVAFLAPLLGTLPLIECPGIAFKFFLPQEVEPALQSQSWFRTDRLHLFHITWNETDLLALIGQRLTYFSRRQEPYASLGQLCGDPLAGIIDRELVTYAHKQPRAALILADRLLQEHCKQAKPSPLIGLKSWERVKAVWLAQGQSFREAIGLPEETFTSQPEPAESAPSLAFGPSGHPILRLDEEKSQVLLGEQDITREIRPQDYRVLLCLYKYLDRVCSVDFLIEKAWSDDRQYAGVTNQSVTASVARLRRTFEELSPGTEYIKTFKTLGYRLYFKGLDKSRADV